MCEKLKEILRLRGSNRDTLENSQMIQWITWKDFCDWIKAVLSVKYINKKIYEHENYKFIGVKRHAYISSQSQNFDMLSLPYIFINILYI